MAPSSDLVFSVFTKPWKNPLPELAERIHGLGFDGVELPVRPGFQVEPDNVKRDLPEAAKIFKDQGIQITNLAGAIVPPAVELIEACGLAGVPMIRTMIGIPQGRGYLEVEAEAIKAYQDLIPALEDNNVSIIIQNHANRNVASAAGLRRVVQEFDPKHVAANYDPAHCALNGEEPDLAIDILWSHMRAVNLKNACYRRVNGPEASKVRWEFWWTSGRQGLADWPEVARLLKAKGYSGLVILTAQYSDESELDRLTAEDLEYAKSLFAR